MRPVSYFSPSPIGLSLSKPCPSLPDIELEEGRPFDRLRANGLVKAKVPVLNPRTLFWLILAIPAALMIAAFARGELAMDLVHPSGETSARLMIVAIALAPLRSLTGPRRWLDWLIARRRSLGIAAFLYALLHLGFYLIDMDNLGDVLAEIGALGIWTGWAAFALTLVPALTSSNVAMRAMKTGWKRAQRFVYPVAILTLVHWIFIHNNLATALIHFIPLALLLAARAIKTAKGA